MPERRNLLFLKGGAGFDYLMAGGAQRAVPPLGTRQLAAGTGGLLPSGHTKTRGRGRPGVRKTEIWGRGDNYRIIFGQIWNDLGKPLLLISV